MNKKIEWENEITPLKYIEVQGITSHTFCETLFGYFIYLFLLVHVIPLPAWLSGDLFRFHIEGSIHTAMK